jgi:hypothetical protein
LLVVRLRSEEREGLQQPARQARHALLVSAQAVFLPSRRGARRVHRCSSTTSRSGPPADHPRHAAGHEHDGDRERRLRVVAGRRERSTCTSTRAASARSPQTPHRRRAAHRGQGQPEDRDDQRDRQGYMFIQVPLKQKQIARGDGPGWAAASRSRHDAAASGSARGPIATADWRSRPEERREGEERRRAGGPRPRQVEEVLRGPQPSSTRRSLPDPRDRAVLQGDLERGGGGQRSDAITRAS